MILKLTPAYDINPPFFMRCIVFKKSIKLLSSIHSTSLLLIAMLDIFISHSTSDKATITRLQKQVEIYGLSTWVNSRELTRGDPLADSIKDSIRDARHFLVVLSQKSIASEWVQKEVRFAQELVKQRDDGFKVIPVVLPGTLKGHLSLLFGKEHLYINVAEGAIGSLKCAPFILHCSWPGAPIGQSNSSR